MTGPSTIESDDPLTLSPDARWLDASRVRDAGFRIALALALFGHLFLGVVLMGGLDGVLGGILGSGREAHRQFGDEKGQLDGVAAEVIDAAEFNKRYVSFQAGKAEAESQAQAQKPAEQAQPQPEEKPEPKPQEQAAAEKPADGWEESRADATPAEKRATPEPKAQEATKQERKPREEKPRDEPKPEEKPRDPQPAQRQMFSDAEMQQLVTQSIEDVQSALVSVSTPGAARLGEASPFVRGVIRTLKVNMPKPTGMKGKVLLRLLVGTSGEIEAIRIVVSSGRADLDRFVAERVARTRLSPPPATASVRERTFQISYEYN